MKGVVFLGDRKLELRDFPDPTPGPRESMRMGDRVFSAVARRAPSVLRAASRFEDRKRAAHPAT